MSQREPVLIAKDLRKWFPLSKGFFHSLLGEETRFVRAVDDISFEIYRGEILGLAGESGSGKTTVGELLVGLNRPTKGQIRFNGRNIAELLGSELRAFRRHSQVIFQDPYESLNPGYTVYRTVMEPLNNFGIGRREERVERISEALERTGMKPPEEYLYRFPHQLSGGQRQRIAIARAIVVGPELVVADEPVSMLDVSVRAGILNLLKRLNQQMGLTILYITHDLSTLSYICNRTAIMYLGKIVEMGGTTGLVRNPLHPYTKALVAAVPRVAPNGAKPRVEIIGQIASPIDLPVGCRFRPRCPRAREICEEREPPLLPVGEERRVACHLYSLN
jgi:peptide/nickel transport system ATP-binding protein